MRKWSAILVTSALLAGMLPAAAFGQTTQQGEIQASVSFRKAPSTSGEFIRYLKSGEDVTIIGQPNSYWYEVIDSKGNKGFVSSQSKYISVTRVVEQAEEVAAPAPVSATNGEIVASVSFRTEPSASSSRIRYLSKGEQVTVLEMPTKYWYKVKDKFGDIGYISTSAKYVNTSYTPPVVESPFQNTPTSQLIEQVINAGMNYLGTPYEYGSDRSTTTTFDCSDFLRQIFIEGMGITLPADSRQQGTYVKEQGPVVKDWKQLKRGDLMFFSSYKGTKASSYSGVNKETARITHVSIYLGDGKMLHTYSAASGGVKVDTISGKHWEYRYLYGGSVTQ